MNNTLKVMCVFGALAALTACGDDDNGGDSIKTPDSSVVTRLDGGTPDTGVPGIDSSVPNNGNDGGNTQQPPTGDCFTGTPAKLVDFLNRCTTPNVVTVTKATLGLPADALDANGNVKPL